MQATRWQKGAIVIPAVFALGAATAFSLKGNAGPKVDPVQPSAQALSLQNGFEQVAEKLRPSVVYIKSRQAASPAAMFRQGRQDDPGDDDFGGMFRMFPGAPGGGQRFRMFPGMPGQGMQGMPRRAYASGSGVIVRSDGYILTNDHVVNGADKVTVQLQDGREFPGKVMRDFKSDLAVIKVDATGLPAAELADSDKAKVGQWAIAFGSPFGYELRDTMTLGIVSALHRQQQIGAGADGRLYPSLIQTDASINPGNSGGPLVDLYGRVVGINVAIESPSGGNVGIGFAIPANTAKYVMDQLINKGSVTRGFLGLAPQTLTYDQQRKYGVQNGALVMSVQDGTPASKAGFQVEDVIVRFDGKPVNDDAAFRDMVARTAPGTTVPVVVQRNGSERTLDVTVGKAPDAQVAQGDAPAAENAKSKLGVQVADASNPDVRKELNLKGDVTQGAVVAGVVPGSPAADAGIQPGDIIVRLDGKAIASGDQLVQAARGLKDSGTVTAVIRRGNQTVLVDINLD